MRRMRATLLTVLLMAAAVSSFAQTVPPAANDVGEVVFANSGAEAAQEPFRRGLALLHNFEYPFAAEAFRAAQQADPEFAMAYWGEAMTYTHPVWFQQDADAARAALARFGKTPAERLAKAKTERERDYLRTVDVLYGEGSKNQRDFLFADAMAALHAKYPDDVDATAFYALALLGTAHEGRDFAIYMRAASLLEEVFPSHMRHPGVLHYLIHSYDDPVHAPLGMRAARLYGGVAPNAGHALHMTSHIFIAMGMWDDVIDANRRAIDVVNAQRAARSKPRGDCGHYPTWLHYAYLQQHRDDDARKALETCRAAAFAEPFVGAGPMDTRSARIDEYAAMRAYQVASGLPLTHADDVTIPKDAEFDDARFTVAYSDVLAAAQKRDSATLTSARGRMLTLADGILKGLAAKGSTNPTARMSVEVMLQEAEALQLIATGKRSLAFPILEAAAEAERGMPLEFGPPVVPKPAAELLAEQLAAAGRTADAVAAYRTSLARTPGRALSVEGLRRLDQTVPATPKAEPAAEGHVH
jgi:tetratricopeptide (TPR) repeat protein